MSDDHEDIRGLFWLMKLVFHLSRASASGFEEEEVVTDGDEKMDIVRSTKSNPIDI